MNISTSLKLIVSCLLLAALLLSPQFCLAKDSSTTETKTKAAVLSDPGKLIDNFVRDKYQYSGLASYYADVAYFIVAKDQIKQLSNHSVYIVPESGWLAAVGRFEVLLISSKNLSVQIKKNSPTDIVLGHIDPSELSAKIVTKSDLSLIAPELDALRYHQLWAPLAWLSKVVENSLVFIQTNIISYWGLAILLFSILLKIILTPLHILTIRVQQHTANISEQLSLKLRAIKSQYDGEEAHNLIMAEHKKLGVSPFYILKPLIVSLIQVPILIAVFNALGEMHQLQGHSLFWINDLSYPDSVGQLPFTIPFFGNNISLLPFIMSIATLVFAHITGLGRSMKLYLMTTVFFILFYPFPAAMLVYWTIVNALQAIHQILMKA